LNTPLGLGGFISIFGSGLANQIAGAQTLPYPNKLSTTQVFLGAEAIPLAFVASGQVNGLVPFDITPFSKQQIIVQQGNAISLPQVVTMGTTQPAVFTQDGSGKGFGIVVAIRPDHSSFEISSTEAASAGDVLVIYCAGLGAVAPAVPAGAMAPLSPLSNTVDPVTVTMGTTSVPAAFAGLAPGFAGLYQVNVVVPNGIPASNNVPLTLTVDGQTSAPVTINLK
jgi:uncharacterized protein (TIGR03437 family)